MHDEACLAALEFWLRLQSPAELHLPDKRHLRRLIEYRCLVSASWSPPRIICGGTDEIIPGVRCGSCHAWWAVCDQYSSRVPESFSPADTHELLLEEGVNEYWMFSKDNRRAPQALFTGDDPTNGLDGLLTCHLPGLWDVGSGCCGP
ncbi:hypothetical protein CORC01_07009 [Colletotrichum orchidophilum]|uniref:Uncharacterized protein n=1 Tax=Colletotrichum orchidophilum TaxID=1209926 RepID=A0A1G4B888_9PEZI|nr:uncharacterized protein CORC01_07009 [Colletotrichum orchidophilum]OHE97594.1 hypothetical protein CORC01_07009 [Colletotrichum orchidophilum]